MGLLWSHSVSAKFQYSVNAVLRDFLYSYAMVYLHDILVFCTSQEIFINSIFNDLQQRWLCWPEEMLLWPTEGGVPGVTGQRWIAHRLQGDWRHHKLAAPSSTGAMVFRTYHALKIVQEGDFWFVAAIMALTQKRAWLLQMPDTQPAFEKWVFTVAFILYSLFCTLV